jgi:hypothetical protein
MIFIPLNKALIAKETKSNSCRGCYFYKEEDLSPLCSTCSCHRTYRKDGKNVIFKLIDLPQKGRMKER